MFDNIGGTIIKETSVYLRVIPKNLGSLEAILKYLLARLLIEVQSIGIYRVLSHVETESYEVFLSSPDVDESIIGKESIYDREVFIGPSSCFDREEEFPTVFKVEAENQM